MRSYTQAADRLEPLVTTSKHGTDVASQGIWCRPKMHTALLANLCRQVLEAPTRCTSLLSKQIRWQCVSRQWSRWKNYLPRLTCFVELNVFIFIDHVFPRPEISVNAHTQSLENSQNWWLINGLKNEFQTIFEFQPQPTQVLQ